MRVSTTSGLLAVVLTGAGLSNAGEDQRPSNRTDSLEALCQRLEIGPGAVVADVGCGHGADTGIFARIVGKRGTVLAQEIDAAQLQRVVDRAAQRDLHPCPLRRFWR